MDSIAKLNLAMIMLSFYQGDFNPVNHHTTFDEVTG